MVRLLVILIFVSTVMVSNGFITAQTDDDFVTFTSADGKLTFQHPAALNIYESEDGTSFGLSWTSETGNFDAHGEIINTNSPVESTFCRIGLANSAEAVVDYISETWRYRDCEVVEGWEPIEILRSEDVPTIAFVCDCSIEDVHDRHNYFFAVDLQNGNYFALQNAYIALQQRDLILEILKTMQYKQQTVYEIDFPAPESDDEPFVWRIMVDAFIFPTAATTDADDNIYIYYPFPHAYSQGIVVLDRDGQVERSISHPSMEGYDIGVGPDGSIWIAGGKLHRFSSDGQEQTLSFDHFYGLQLAVDADGNVVILNNAGSPAAVTYSPDGELIHEIDAAFTENAMNHAYDLLDIQDGFIPGISVTDDQIIYIHNPRNGQLHAYDMNGNEVETALVSQLKSEFPSYEEDQLFPVAEGIRFFHYGRDGLFYIEGSASDKPNGVYVYNQDGEQVAFADDLSFPLLVLSDGSIVVLRHNEIALRQPIE